MAQGVIDDLEVVEIDEQHGGTVPGGSGNRPAGPPKGMVETIPE
jgi:hypothetical protein